MLTYIKIGIAAVVALLIFYAYYTYNNLVKENEILSKNVATLKANEKEIISAYEFSIKQIEKKTEVEATNKEASKASSKANIKLKTIKDKYKNETINNNDYTNFSF